ncbi:DUF2087 domain-containing protein [Xanthobacter sp. KR7-65]|uniref:DUF2087 domain-containing protein n=1 Tax=Xanthobacter sp. KR7-65 TaxID=3156612 RepID=UPI0032B31A93
MSRTPLPFAAGDVSALARALGRELNAAPEKLGHVQLLNVLVRAAGYRNFQHFRAQQAAGAKLAAAPPPASAPVDLRLVADAARHYDGTGRLVRWPSKESRRILALWVLWSRLPAATTLTEAQINAELRALHLFDDPALLRRAMVDLGLLWRTRDGGAYRRIGQRPPPEALALIRHLGRGLAQ